MALASMAASTEESTPPDRAQSTLPSPMRSRRALTLFSTKESIFQSPVQPQTLYTKLRSIFLPSAVWSTSGWNWTAYRPFSSFSAAATGQLTVWAVILKPGAACSM